LRRKNNPRAQVKNLNWGTQLGGVGDEGKGPKGPGKKNGSEITQQGIP